jgi:arylsulfatase A-like enzyme
VRAKSLSLYGNQRETTPNLSRYSREGVVFENAIAPSSWTLPSHASMFTGKYPHQLSVDWHTPLDDTFSTIADELTIHNYRTAGFVSNFSYCSYEQGLSRGFEHFEDYPISLGQLVLSASLLRELTTSDIVRNHFDYHEMLNRKPAHIITDSFLKWVSLQNDERPYFAFLNYYDAHEPYLPPPPYDEYFGARRPADTDFAHLPSFITRRDKWSLSEQEIQYEFDAYEGAIAYLDSEIGRLLDTLERLDERSDTIVIITSDHGEQFGEHGLFDHGTSLYRPLVEVPLVIFPADDNSRGVRIEEPVTLCDLPATIMDLVGISDQTVFPGNSLRSYWQPDIAEDISPRPVLAELTTGGKIVPSWYPIASGDMQAIVHEGLFYIRNGDDREELYDYFGDTNEEINLAEKKAYYQQLLAARSALDEALSL